MAAKKAKKKARRGRPPKPPSELGESYSTWFYKETFDDLHVITTEHRCSGNHGIRMAIRFLAESIREQSGVRSRKR